MLPIKIVCDMVFYIKNYTRPVFFAPAGIIFYGYMDGKDYSASSSGSASSSARRFFVACKPINITARISANENGMLIIPHPMEPRIFCERAKSIALSIIAGTIEDTSDTTIHVPTFISIFLSQMPACPLATAV